MEEDKDLIDIQVKYEFTSGFGPMDGDRYIQDIHARICRMDDFGTKQN